MQAGKLRHRITLQSLTETQNPSTGAITKTWADVATVWGDVRFLGGLETLKADATTAVRKCSVRIRYLAGVTEKMRVVHEGANFDINNVSPDNTGRRYLDLACTAGASNG